MRDAEFERILKALANRRRVAILRYLKKHNEASVGELSEAIQLSFKATSKHLIILVSADIIEREQRGLLMFYRLLPTHSAPARALLSTL